jgi:hypothetical protein
MIMRLSPDALLKCREYGTEVLNLTSPGAIYTLPYRLANGRVMLMYWDFVAVYLKYF